jgi:hypothetical protein
MTFKVTHIDHRQRRRQLVLVAPGRAAAEAQALQQLGAAHYLAVIVLRGRGV